ncbi:MAG TPA: type II toxin-antitoxin system RelE/ParE family toxin [Azospirillum sp.]|nr:type II toxin-antitoxin system RelE/ParE family toxin [Azospirillum sp.]
MDVRWSPTAFVAATRISNYISAENPAAGDAVLQAMVDAADSLAHHPYRHRNRGGGYRRIPVAHYDYFILYRIRHADDGPYISIESVRHVARRPRTR